ncbi:response regulator transcription factor, partial [Streptomyces sp. OR43]|uniref:response regulator transcription factor n=1 Tax=Streptomyces sp. or43 TaxID=2478957 RepID=UPI0021C64047
ERHRRHVHPLRRTLPAHDLHAQQPARAVLRELSGREVEVLRLVAEGQSNKAIGVSMGLSALTVKSHLARIARKLGTGDRAGMVAVALRTGIIH